LTPEVNQLEVFPNPAQSILNIKNENFNGDFQIQLISASGQLIEVPLINNTNTNIQLDISHLPNGVYVLRLISDELYSASFIKQ